MGICTYRLATAGSPGLMQFKVEPEAKSISAPSKPVAQAATATETPRAEVTPAAPKAVSVSAVSAAVGAAVAEAATPVAVPETPVEVRS